MIFHECNLYWSLQASCLHAFKYQLKRENFYTVLFSFGTYHICWNVPVWFISRNGQGKLGEANDSIAHGACYLLSAAIWCGVPTAFPRFCTNIYSYCHPSNHATQMSSNRLWNAWQFFFETWRSNGFRDGQSEVTLHFWWFLLLPFRLLFAVYLCMTPLFKCWFWLFSFLSNFLVLFSGHFLVHVSVCQIWINIVVSWSC